MTEVDPFTGLGKALARLRKQAGYATQTEASEALKIDKGQLSRWENEVPRPTLENLSRLLLGYGATVGDLAVMLGESAAARTPSADAETEERPRADEGLIQALTEAIRRVEGRQVETESRMERIERGLEAVSRPAPLPRANKG